MAVLNYVLGVQCPDVDLADNVLGEDRGIVRADR